MADRISYRLPLLDRDRSASLCPQRLNSDPGASVVKDTQKAHTGQHKRYFYSMQMSDGQTVPWRNEFLRFLLSGRRQQPVEAEVNRERCVMIDQIVGDFHRRAKSSRFP